MAVIYLELEIDSDIYPELHAVLALMSNNMARGERLRQLAGTGLIWEQCRAQGLYSQPSPALPAAAAASPVARRAAEPAAPARGGAAKASPSSKKSKPAKSAEGFVDLALNALPTPDESPGETLSPEEIRNEILGETRGGVEKKGKGGAAKPADIPMLSDVVSPDEAPFLIHAVATNPQPAVVHHHHHHHEAADDDDRVVISDPLPSGLPADEAPAAMARHTHLDGALSESGQGGAHGNGSADQGASSDPHHHDASAFPQKTVKRRRLMRMKEMGLFKNG